MINVQLPNGSVLKYGDVSTDDHDLGHLHLSALLHVAYVLYLFPPYVFVHISYVLLLFHPYVLVHLHLSILLHIA